MGNTVRRPVQGNSPLVHALLRHLEDVGFAGAPRFLGIDSAGREVLTYVEGEVAGRPRPAWIADEDRLVSVGRLVRAYDDAAATFVVPPGAEPDPGLPDPPGIPPAPPYPPELIGHVDITPENVVFRDGQAVALIDFDLAKWATRADEMYSAMMWWAPLRDPRTPTRCSGTWTCRAAARSSPTPTACPRPTAAGWSKSPSCALGVRGT